MDVFRNSSWVKFLQLAWFKHKILYYACHVSVYVAKKVQIQQMYLYFMGAALPLVMMYIK